MRGGSMRPYCQNSTVCIKSFYCIPVGFFWHHRLSTSLKQAQNDEVSDGGVLPETKVILVTNSSRFPFLFSCLSAKPCIPKTCGCRIIIHMFILILLHSNTRKSIQNSLHTTISIYLILYQSDQADITTNSQDAGLRCTPTIYEIDANKYLNR